jgi:peptide/nickel transport system permease protein
MADIAASQQLLQPSGVPESEERDEVGGYSLGSMLRLLVASNVGKASVVLFAVMLGISAWVLLTYPSNFGKARWSNPVIWADNPKSSPPVWTTWLGGDGVAQKEASVSSPVSTETRPQGELRTYQIPYHFDSDDFPGFLSVTFTGITFSSRATIAIELIRPDSDQPVRLANVVPAPNPGETAPYRRYYDTPERVLLSSQDTASQSIVQFFGTAYPGLALPANLNDHLNESLFGRPADDGSGRIVPLHGDYTLQIRALVADPNDQIAPIEAVFSGTVFGVMGTDGLGRDLWEGLLYGFPVALLIATLVASVSTFIGAALGILSGYAGGATDAVIQRLADVVSTVPILPLLIFLIFVFGPNLWLIILILVAFSWPGLTILVRSIVLQIRSGQLVEAAQALGASRKRIMIRHVFPQVAPFIVAQMIFFAPGAILAEAGLSFLGLGDPSIPTWGQMLQAGFQSGALYVGYWWWVLPPGILIVFTALAFMLLALAMEPIVDPRLRRMS